MVTFDGGRSPSPLRLDLNAAHFFNGVGTAKAVINDSLFNLTVSLRFARRGVDCDDGLIGGAVHLFCSCKALFLADRESIDDYPDFVGLLSPVS